MTGETPPAAKGVTEALNTLADRVEFAAIGPDRFKRSALNSASIDVLVSELRRIAALSLPLAAKGVTEAMVDAFAAEFYSVRTPVKWSGSQRNDIRRALEAALSLPALGGEAGWVLVPRDPTELMIDNAEETMEEKRNFGMRIYAADVWSAMLAVAPLASPRLKVRP